MSATMHILGAFRTVEGAKLAVERLADADVPRDSISLLVSEDARRRLATVERHTKAPEGVAAGGIAGGVLGGIVAGLTTVAAVAMPGVGLLAAGPLVAALAGAGAGAAAGGIIGGLMGLGMSEHEAKYYTDIIGDNGVLVAVSTDDKLVKATAKQTLADAGALSLESSRGLTAHV